MKLSIELPSPTVLPVEQKRIFAQLFLDYRKTLVEHVQKVLWFLCEGLEILGTLKCCDLFFNKPFKAF